MLATYHNHTSFSDGKATIAEMCDAAIAQGIDELGISDHACVMPDRSVPAWSIDGAQIDAYIRALRDAQPIAAARGLILRAGLEVDWFPETREATAALLAGLDLDFLIGSVHFDGTFGIDGSPHAWKRLSEDERNAHHRAYWTHIRDMAASGMFDIVGHIDLSKKFGYLPTVDLSVEIDAALDVIADGGMVVEINTAGWHKPCHDAYPTLDILKRCHARDIRVTISSDAHRPADLVRDFGPAADRLSQAGYTEVARFAHREIRMEPLAEAVGQSTATDASMDLDDF